MTTAKNGSFTERSVIVVYTGLPALRSLLDRNSKTNRPLGGEVTGSKQCTKVSRVCLCTMLFYHGGTSLNPLCMLIT